MKKILLITESIGSGGAERQICGLAAMLTRYGYPCRLLTYNKNQFYESYLHDNGVDYEFKPEFSRKVDRVFRVASYVRKYNPDVVISYLTSVNITMCLAHIFFKAKLIVSERNNNISVISRDRLRFNLYRLADAVVPNSNSQGQFICRNFSFLQKKVHPIINFVDLDRFTPAEVYPNNNPLRVVIVARYTHQKNVLTFLDVVKEVKALHLNIRFDWYGSKEFDPMYYAQVQNKYHNLSIDDYLSLHGPSYTIEEEYRKADAMCLPSLFEGYPNVVVEAMSCGLPVICANRFEIPYIVEDNVNGFLFNPESVEDIISAIVKLVKLSAEDRRLMGMKNHELCLKRNTADAFIHSYVKLIDNL